MYEYSNTKNSSATSLRIVNAADFGLPKQEKEQLNVLFILADDFGYHDLGMTGSQLYDTPNIDRLGSEGFQFINGYASCQVCSPSRASIQTGKYPVNVGITDWIGAKTDTNWRSQKRFDKLLPATNGVGLPLGETTIAEVLQSAGYQTFFAGKWHLGGAGSSPEDHGFNINVGGWSAGSPIGGFFDPYKNPRLPNELPGENLSHRLARETSAFIERTEEPFFAFLSFYAVHAPLQTSQVQWAKYQEKALRTGLSDHGYEMERVLPARVQQDNPIYAGMVNSMDQAIGKVLRTLKEQNLDKNTIVVFTSDNGGVSSGDGYATSNRPLRGGKGYQWEGGLRVPYIIYLPWMEGGQVDAIANGTDFYPTILDILGIPNDQQTDGVSLLNAIRGNNETERPLFWHYPHYGNQGGEPSSIIREGTYKLIRYFEDDRLELYDLALDPGERNDVAQEFPQIAESMEYTLLKWLDRSSAKLPKADPQYDSLARNERLMRLKYDWLPELERRRLELLSPDFDPCNDWWGSSLPD